MLPKKSLKPILTPPKVHVKSLEDLYQFYRSRPKILNKFKIEQTCIEGNGSFDYLHGKKMVRILVQISKIIKYTRKLDLRKLEQINQPIFRPQTIYFAKKMGHTRAIFLQDLRNYKSNQKEITDSWAKYTKGIHHFSYFLYQGNTYEYRLYGRAIFEPKTVWNFFRALRFQHCLQGLTLWLDPNFLFKDIQDPKFLLRCSKKIQKLSLEGINSQKPIIAAFQHLQNLKSLDLQFHPQSPTEAVTSSLQQLPKTFPRLQSLSIDWPLQLTQDLIPVASAFDEFTHLTQLRLSFSIQLDSSFNEKKTNAFWIPFGRFGACPIKNLTFIATLNRGADLCQIIQLLKNFPQLESLKLKFECSGHFDQDSLENIFQIIEDLAFLKNISIFIDRTGFKKKEKLKLPERLSKLFEKSILFESFKIRILPNKKNDYFMQLLESLKPATSTLKKLRIDLGEFEPKKKEFEIILNFIQSLQKIQSLKLDTLRISELKFFIELFKILQKKLYLRTLSVGKIMAGVTKPKFMQVVEGILQKEGLKDFDCEASGQFQSVLEENDENIPKISLKKLKKINLSLKRVPDLDIFDEPKGKRRDREI